MHMGSRKKYLNCIKREGGIKVLAINKKKKKIWDVFFFYLLKNSYCHSAQGGFPI